MAGYGTKMGVGAGLLGISDLIMQALSDRKADERYRQQMALEETRYADRLSREDAERAAQQRFRELQMRATEEALSRGEREELRGRAETGLQNVLPGGAIPPELVVLLASAGPEYSARMEDQLPSKGFGGGVALPSAKPPADPSSALPPALREFVSPGGPVLKPTTEQARQAASDEEKAMGTKRGLAAIERLRAQAGDDPALQMFAAAAEAGAGNPPMPTSEWDRRQGVEHKNRLSEIAAQGAAYQARTSDANEYRETPGIKRYFALQEEIFRTLVGRYPEDLDQAQRDGLRKQASDQAMAEAQRMYPNDPGLRALAAGGGTSGAAGPPPSFTPSALRPSQTGAAPSAPAKVLSSAQLREIAQRNGVPEAEARAQAEAQGYTIIN